MHKSAFFVSMTQVICVLIISVLFKADAKLTNRWRGWLWGVGHIRAPGWRGPRRFGQTRPMSSDWLPLFSTAIGVGVMVALVVWVWVRHRSSVRALEIAWRDPATGVYSRAVLLELLAHQLALAARLGYPVALLLVEPDESVGLSRTALRRALARRLVERVRADDLLGHWGEASFLIVLPGTDAGGALVLAQDLRDGLARHGIELDGRLLGISVGVHAHQPLRREPHEELALTLADAAQRALDATRADGPGRIEIEP